MPENQQGDLSLKRFLFGNLAHTKTKHKIKTKCFKLSLDGREQFKYSVTGE